MHSNCFAQAMNKLQFLVASNQKFLNEHLAEVAKGDELMRRFLDIYNKVMDEGTYVQ